MNQETVAALDAAQQQVEPRFRAMREARAALQQAAALARAEKADALPMQKALQKLQAAAEGLDEPALREALAAFEADTQRALDDLAFSFARDLKSTFEGRGLPVEGRPPTLTVGPLTLQMDIAARRAQWFYGKEALGGKLPLSLAAISRAFDQQQKAIVQRQSDPQALLGDLYAAWKSELDSRARKPAGNRLNLVDLYAAVVMNRQSARFRNAPSRATFKDYERAHFVRDLVAAQRQPTVTVDGRRYRLRLGTASKAQAESSGRSVWIPQGDSALQGDYYADVTFEEA